MSNKKTMTPEAVFRIHSAEARSNRSMVSKDSFTARAQKAIAAPPPLSTFCNMPIFNRLIYISLCSLCRWVWYTMGTI